MRRDTSEPARVEPLDRAGVLAATGHHPYARLSTAARWVRGFAGGGATAWLVPWSRGVVATAFGAPDRALWISAHLAGQGELSSVRRVNLPRLDHATLGFHLPVRDPDDWDFRWTRAAPPAQPGQELVVRLTADDHPLITDLLDRAFPTTFTRPGEPGVRSWYGIRGGDGLLACGADRSRGGVGSISGVAVDPAERGNGLGAALTAAMTEAMLGECDVVTLGVMADNPTADRLYRRLGFADAVSRTAADLVA